MKKSDKYKMIKNSFSTKEESFDWWEKNSYRKELGIVALDTKTKKFSFRAGDNTPSTVIYENLNYIDFGGEGTLQDPLARIMEVTGMRFPEALDLFLSWEGEDSIEYNPSLLKPKKKEKKFRDPFSEKYIRQCILNKKKYQTRYDLLKVGLFRASNNKEIKIAERLLKIGFIPKSEYEEFDRIFIPEFDQNGVAYGCYKYNRSIEGRKGLLRKDSKRVIFGSHLLNEFSKDIIYSEGHTDVVANISKRLSCLTTGSSTKPLGENIFLLAGKTIHDFPDLDIAGLLGATKRSIEIIEWNKKQKDFPEKQIKHIVYWWSEWFFDKKLKEKKDLGQIPKSEIFYPFIKNIPDKKGALFFHKDFLSFLQKKYLEKNKKTLPDNLLFSNWILLSKDIKKAGYDFIDFHNENSNNKNYDSFLNKFKF